MSARRVSIPASHVLPDFCSGPILFALILVAGLTIVVMALVPGMPFSWRGFSTAIALAVWLALINGVVLCKLRPALVRLRASLAMASVWLVMVVTVLIVTFIVGWLDHALEMRLTPHSLARFVISGGIASALIGAALLRYFYVVAQWQTRQAAGARARADALQARIRPHFLFNSMNTVAALVHSDPDAAESTVENLSELFRAALASGDDGTLGEEFALIDRYLAIEQLRLGERLHVERDLDALPRDLPMPRLLLQPLVENAVVHGIQPRADGGVVRLQAHVDAGHVVIRIRNPLPGAAATVPGHGVGLDNVRQRLAYHFDNRAELAIDADATHYEVIVRLPRRSHAHSGR